MMLAGSVTAISMSRLNGSRAAATSRASVAWAGGQDRSERDGCWMMDGRLRAAATGAR